MEIVNFKNYFFLGGGGLCVMHRFEAMITVLTEGMGDLIRL